jgi:signal transduction histidine kinase
MTQTFTLGKQPELQAVIARRFPWVWVGSAILLTILMFAGLAWHVRSTFEVGREVAESYVASDRLRDLMTELQQQLATTAILLIATHDPSWKVRHLEVESKLQQALRETIADSESGYNQAALVQARDAISELGRLEAEATSLAEWGEVNEALALLSGDEYRELQRRFVAASQRFIDDHRGFLNERLAVQAEREVQSIGVAFLILLLSLAIWLALVRRLRRWGAALDRESVIRRQLEAELLQSQKMEAVGRLASGIAHDFRNLLTAIRGYVTLARDRIPSLHPARHALGRVEEAADQAEGVIRGLLTFGRRSVAEKQAVDAEDLITRAAAWVQRMVPGTVQLDTLVQKDEDGLWVLADPVQLQQVLLNLVVNACDAMPEGGKVEIAAQRSAIGPDPMVTISVRDTGHGMSEEVAARAFEPFFTTKSASEGTGLGLSMAHGIVTQHDGNLSIDSTPGVGTTVSIRLPAIPAPLASDPTVPDIDGDIGEPGHVLLLEPHDYVRQIMAAALEAAGYTVAPLATTADLLDQLGDEKNSPVLVVLNADLPGSENKSPVHWLRSVGYRGPVLLVSGEPEAEAGDMTDDRVMLLPKPVSMAQLKRLALRMTRTDPERKQVI